MWNSVAIIGHVKPKYVIWENVKNVLSKRHIHNFTKYLNSLDEIGYNNYYQVLNAKDFGVPQNRERIYCVSIRKDIDSGNFQFPNKQELHLTLKDLLENNVDNKFYLSEEKIKKIENSSFLQEKRRIQDKDPKCIRIGGIYDIGKETHQAGSVYDKNGLAPALDTMQGGNRQPMIIIYPTDIDKSNSYIEKKYKSFIEKNDYIPKMFNPYNESEITNIAPTQTANCGSTTSSATILISEDRAQHIRIRKLTPKECWRLMGFSDKDFKKTKAVGVSNSQLYKQAGNSIVVNVLEEIFKKLFL